MRIALLQPSPSAADLASLHISLLEARRDDADVLIVPELLVPGYNHPRKHRREAEPLDGIWMQALRAMVAKVGCALVIGWAERDGDKVYNAASCVDRDGTLLAHYRKVQLFGEMEHASFTPGTELAPPFDLCGRRCGLLICYDIEFPGHTATLAHAGAEVIFVPTANPEGYEHVQEVLVPARAHELGGFVAYANYCGTDNGLTFGGGSTVAGPDGRALARAGTSESLLIVDLPELSDYPPETLSGKGTDFRAAPIAEDTYTPAK
ncbi:carbon-nitrogen hydrolase family protein [Celeribacter ethanolicus]|uniref:Nitrilase n=1 Tax=Celeribacter ethanolicus TaxID=1758178 RepID=A0A291G8I8_9RHOB|nr:carbon-nitrogen hydrolase family protein [Celeribacter ethanolicus]ATG46863.1 nitrilase [Celeribacter ethanolicus]